MSRQRQQGGGGGGGAQQRAQRQLDELDLKEWYGVLEPGSYRLVNRYRPQLDGSWTAESAALLFQVVKQ